MDSVEDALGGVSEVRHEKFDALRVDIVSALNVVLLLNVWHFVGQALSVEVLLRVVSLMLDQMVRGHDRVEASLL